MDELSERALSQIDLAEAELAVLKQEGVLAIFFRLARRPLKRSRNWRGCGNSLRRSQHAPTGIEPLAHFT